MANVNKIDGSLSQAIPLVSLPGQNGLGIGLALSYSSNILRDVTTWNREAPTDVCGLGWKFPLNQVLREPMHTGDQDDDVYLLVFNGATSQLKLVSDDRASSTRNRVYRTAPASYVTITRRTTVSGTVYTSDVWTLTDGSGLTHKFGSAINRNEDSENYQSDGKCIEWEVVWGAWSGPTATIRNASNQRAQQQQPIVWNLRETTSSTGQSVVYDYTLEELQVGNDGGLRYTRCAYLTGILMNPGYRVALSYVAKKDFEYPPTRVWKPSTTNPNYSVTQHQSRFTTKALDTIEIYNQTSFSTDRIASTRLNYSATVGDTANPKLLNAAILEMAKRLLLSVHSYDRFGVETTPPVRFGYWGEDGQGAFVVNKRTSNVFDPNPGGIFGTLRTMTSPMGDISTFYYDEGTSNFARNASFQDPLTYGSDNNMYQFFYGQDVVMMVTRTGPSSNAYLNFKLWGFNGKWEERWSKSVRVNGLQDQFWWTANWTVKVQGNYFIMAIDSGSIVGTSTLPLILYRDPTNVERWVEWGKAPQGYAQYFNFYRDRASWQVQAGSDLAVVYDCVSPRIHAYRFDGNTWSSYEINPSHSLPNAASDVHLAYGAIRHFAVTGPRSGTLTAWRFRNGAFQTSRPSIDISLGSRSYDGIECLQIQSNSSHTVIFYITWEGSTTAPTSAEPILAPIGAVIVAGDSIAENPSTLIVEGEYFSAKSVAPLKYQYPTTTIGVSNNCVMITNAMHQSPNYPHGWTYYTKAWRFNGSNFLASERAETLEGAEIFAVLGHENLRFDKANEGLFSLQRFDARTMSWQPTTIQGSSITEWGRFWKVALNVLGVASLLIGSNPLNRLIADLAIAAFDIFVLVMEMALQPEQLDVDLAYGEDDPYILAVKQSGRPSIVSLYVQNPVTEVWEWVEDTTSAVMPEPIWETASIAVSDRGIAISTRGATPGTSQPQQNWYVHAANGVIRGVEQIGVTRLHSTSRHIDAGHDVMASIEPPNQGSGNVIRLNRYYNHMWQYETRTSRVRAIAVNDGYQTTTTRLEYEEGAAYPVRLDAAAMTALYNKVTERIDDGSDSGAVETYSYNGFLLSPPNAPAGGNALDHSTAVIGATYCTIATGNAGVVSTDKALHQVYAIEKGGETEYLALEVGSINETDGVVTSQQATSDIDLSGNPRESRSFAGLPDLSVEHQAARTTYAHEVPGYAALKAKGFLDGPARAESEIRNAIPSTVTTPFSTRWGRGFGAVGDLDQNAPFAVARGASANNHPNRIFSLYKTVQGAVTHVCSDFADSGAIINGGSSPSELDGAQPATPTLIGPSGNFPTAMVGWIGPKKGQAGAPGVPTLEIVQANATRVVPIAPTSPKLGLGDVLPDGSSRTVLASVGSRVYRIAVTSSGVSTGFLDLGNATTTSPFAMRSDWFAVGLAGSPGGSDWAIVCRQKTLGTEQSGFNARLGCCSALTEIAGVSYGTGERQFYLMAGAVRGDLLDIVVLDGASTTSNGTVLAKLTGLQAARPATIDSLFAWRDPGAGAVTVHVLQGESVATLRFTPAAGATPASLVLVSRSEFVGTPIGTPVLDDSGRLFLAVKGADSGGVISIGTDGRLAGSFRLDSATEPGAGVTAPLARAGTAVAALGVTDLANPTMAKLVGVTAIVPKTPLQVSATTWDTTLVAPVASYAWRGIGSPAFAGWTAAAGTDYPDWVRSDAVVSSDPATAAPIEVLSTDGDLGSVLLGAESLVTVATFSSGSVRQGTAFFTAFERYERLVTNAQASFTSQCLTGSRGLTIMAEANAVTLAIADQPLRQAAGKLVLCLWAEAAGSFRVNLIGAPDLAMTATFAASPANAWAKYETVFEVGDAWRGKTLSLAIATTGTHALLVDHIWLAPLGAAMQAVVRKPVTLAPVATIDQRGGVGRIVNDHFDAPVAAVAPDGQPVRLTASQLALRRSGATVLDPAKPNTTLDMPLFGGGKATSFDVDFTGWQVTPGNTVVQNREVILGSGQTLRNSSNTGQQSWVVRLQLNARPDVAAKPDGQVKIELGGGNGVVASWSGQSGGMAGTLQLSVNGASVASVACPWGRDWLIASIGDSGLIAQPKATVYVVVDGEIAVAQPSDTRVTLSSIAISKVGGGTGSISVRDPVVGHVPGATITYVDGSGDARQVQAHESAQTLVIQETVYDRTKTARFQTVPTRKGAGATKNQSFAFEAGFVEKRNPASGGDLWSTDSTYQNSGSMAGLVQTWRQAEGLDMDSSFYSYDALYPTTDPLQRDKEATDSAKEFAVGRAGSVRSSYGRDAGINALLDAGGVSQRDRARFAAQTGSSALQHPGTGIPERRAIGRSAQDVLGHLTISEASAITITGSPPVISEDTTKLRSSAAMTWTIDAGQTITARMPNSYASGDANAYKVTTVLDRFGRPVTSTGPDRGRSDMVYDDLDRLRFAQDAVGAQSPQFFLYRDYDREGRVSEAGLIVRDWDVGLLNAAAPYPAWRTRQGARATWSCDQASGALADSSGNALSGTISGATFVADGPNGLGNCLAFDGNDYVDLGTPSLLSNLTAVTISAWVKLDASVAGDCGIVVGGASNSYISLAYRKASSKIDLVIGSTSAQAGLSQSGWVHVVAAATSQGVRIHLDGVPTSISGTRSFPTVTLNWALGCSTNGSSRSAFFKGSLRDVRIYPHAIDDGVAKALYLEGLVRPSSRLVYDAYPNASVTEFNGLPAQLLTYNRAVTDAGRPDMTAANRNAEGLVAERYRYDANGRVTEQIVKVPDFDAVERTIGYGYDAPGNVNKINYPS